MLCSPSRLPCARLRHPARWPGLAEKPRPPQLTLAEAADHNAVGRDAGSHLLVYQPLDVLRENLGFRV